MALFARVNELFLAFIPYCVFRIITEPYHHSPPVAAGPFSISEDPVLDS